MSSLISYQKFKHKYNLSDEKFRKANIAWVDLEKIYEHYCSLRDYLLPTAKSIVEVLLSVSNVHSVKYRVKDAEHLIEKIIRKRSDGRDINISNYYDEITDLIGIRVLHLFKEDWEAIHDFISEQWTLKEKPTANIRNGDSEKLTAGYVNKGCDIKIHKAGYRSLHYLIVSNLTKKQYVGEIQVRTIFEEAWSEIDHKVRYPYNTQEKVLSDYLEIFNRLAGSADEMGSYINCLSKKLDEKDMTYEDKLREKDKIISELQNEVEQLKRQRIDLNIEANNQYPVKREDRTPKDLMMSELSLKNLDKYLEKANNPLKVNNLAESAGFTVKSIYWSGRNAEPLLELKLYLETVHINSIKELDQFIENNLSHAKDYYKAQVSAAKDNWYTNIAFNIVLLIIMNNLEIFGSDKLIKMGWYGKIAERVVAVAAKWKKENNFNPTPYIA